MERLHKVLAAAGVASRRHCEELIAEGHVTVDGMEVKAMGTLVDAEKQDIRYNGERIQREDPAYFLCYKPVGYLCTNRDEYGRPTVVSLVRDRRHRRLFTVGRLDEDSEGLIIITNDGEFANRVAHPRYGLEKVYTLKVHGWISNDAIDKARKGVWLAEGRSGALYVKLQKRSKQFSYVMVKVGEGRNRMLRRVFAKLGHGVAKLKRVRIGSLGVKGISRGDVRVLSRQEVKDLLSECEARREAGVVQPGPPARRHRVKLDHPSGKPEHQKHKRRRGKSGSPSSSKGSRSQGRGRSGRRR